MNSASSNEPLRLTDSKQSDVKPAESKPSDSKPSDSKPVSSKPSDDMPAQQTPLEDTPAIVKSSKSTRWNVESDTAISHPIINEETKKLPKILIWKDLFVSVPIQVSGGWIKKRSKKTRIVLKGVSGVAEPGEILAIMGESGAGKTTLLNVLTQRFKKALTVEGEVNVNGEILSPTEMRKISVFVQQFDIFYGSMTVREYLVFCAQLRMGTQFTYGEKMAKVEEVITKMGLTKCQDTVIGLPYTKSISLGEKKRLSFACELLHDPSIIFCDEPTSGLDAFMANQVIMCLKNLAKQDGLTIVITIHQPSSQIFKAIDKVLFMANGSNLYLGPTKKVPAFFATLGYVMPIYTNPPEFVVKTLAMQEHEDEAAHKDRIEGIIHTYMSSQMAQDYLIRTHGMISERRKLFNEDLHSSSRYNATWWTQFWWLLKRSFMKTLRDPLMMKIRVFHVTLTAAFISMIFWQLEVKRETIMSLDGFLAISTNNSFFIYMFPTLLVFTEELIVFLRENHARIYRTSAYFISKNVAELPTYIFLPSLYAVIIYFATIRASSYNALEFFQSLAIYNTATFMAISIGYAASTIFGRVDIAVQIMPCINFPLMAMAGFFIKLDTVRSYFRPLTYISWFRYTFEALMLNIWSFRSGAIPGCEVLNEANLVACTGRTGIEHLEYNNFHTNSGWVWINVAILFTMAMIVRTISLIALLIRNYVTDG